MDSPLAENVRILAGVHGIPLAYLSRALGMSKQGLNNIVQGHSNPSMTTVAKIAAFFGVTLNDLTADPTDLLRAAAQSYHDAPARTFKTRNLSKSA